MILFDSSGRSAPVAIFWISFAKGMSPGFALNRLSAGAACRTFHHAAFSGDLYFLEVQTLALCHVVTGFGRLLK